MNDPKTRDRVLDEINASTLDDVAPIGGEKVGAFLKEMNSLADDHDEFAKRMRRI